MGRVGRSLSPLRLLFVAIFVLSMVLIVHSQTPLQVGYAVITAAEGSSLPVTSALFSSTNAEGILIWEAGVAAVEPIPSGRIFVDQQESTRTAIALVNPSAKSGSVTLTLRDNTGNEIGHVRP